MDSNLLVLRIHELLNFVTVNFTITRVLNLVLNLVDLLDLNLVLNLDLVDLLNLVLNLVLE